MGPRYSLPSLLLLLLSMYISIHGVISSIELTRYILRSQEKPVSSHITVHTTVVSRLRHCVFLCNRHPECIASHVTPDSVCTMYGPDLDSPFAITLHAAVGKTYIHGKWPQIFDHKTLISFTALISVVYDIIWRWTMYLWLTKYYYMLSPKTSSIN